MKNYIKLLSLLFISFMYLITSVYSFDIYNSENVSKIYFSVNDPEVFVRTGSNDSVFNVTYSYDGNDYVKNYSYISCSYGKCGDFSIIDMIKNDNNSFSGSVTFDVNSGNDSKKIYFDIEKPDFTINNYSIDRNNEKIVFNLSYSDNYGVDKIELYTQYNSVTKLVENILVSKNSSNFEYIYNVEDSGDVLFRFNVLDISGNIRQVEETIFVPDFSVPKILDTNIIYKDNSYNFGFKVSDNNLSRYEISQNGIKVTGDINKSGEFESSINIPFDSGSISFTVYDHDDNKVTKSYSLSSPLEINFNSRYSKNDNFVFNSNAEECVLISVDSKSYDDEFSKSSSTFSRDLSLGDDGKYDVVFYCDKNSFRQYFEKEFYYDTKAPEKVDVSVVANNEGFLEISWDESFDDQSDVEYTLYKDGDDIYEGTKERFEDEDVIFPNEYSYYLEISDEAGNSIKSESVSKIPKKVFVNLDVNLNEQNTVNNENITLKIDTDENSDVTFFVRNLGDVYVQKNYYDVTDRISEELTLKEGVNEINVAVEDEFGNNLKKSYFITYNPPIVNNVNELNDARDNTQNSQKDSSNAILNSSKDKLNESSKQESSSAQEDGVNWWWVLFWFILFIIIILLFIFKMEDIRDRISTRDAMKRRRKNVQDVKKRDMEHYLKKRNGDSNLSKNLDIIKKNRIKKQKEAEEKALRDKENFRREKGEFEKKKHEDLANRREVVIPFETRKKAQKSARKAKKNDEYELSLEQTSNRWREKEKKKGFLGFMFTKEEKKDDPFSDYLREKKSGGWDSKYDYIVREPKVDVSQSEVVEEKPVEETPEQKRKRDLEDRMSSNSKDENIKKNRTSFFGMLGFGSKQKKKGNVGENKEFEKDSKFDAERAEAEKNKIDEAEKSQDVSEPEEVSKTSSKKSSNSKDSLSLDDYLNKRKKKKSLYFVEKEVERELKKL